MKSPIKISLLFFFHFIITVQEVPEWGFISRQKEISVKVKGNGISDSIKEKMFQPFFTTKPTRQGTGLGLSLSYDIAKAHGGAILVHSEDGKRSGFRLQLNC